MYKIEGTSFGAKITFSGFVQEDEMKEWANESAMFVKTLPPKFGVLIDMRGMKALPSEAQIELKRGQKHFTDNGLERSAVILNDPITSMQCRRIAKETGIYAYERYLDASTKHNWEEAAKKWLINSVDPDTQT